MFYFVVDTLRAGYSGIAAYLPDVQARLTFVVCFGLECTGHHWQSSTSPAINATIRFWFLTTAMRSP